MRYILQPERASACTTRALVLYSVTQKSDRLDQRRSLLLRWAYNHYSLWHCYTRTWRSIKKQPNSTRFVQCADQSMHMQDICRIYVLVHMACGDMHTTCVLHASEWCFCCELIMCGFGHVEACGAYHDMLCTYNFHCTSRSVSVSWQWYSPSIASVLIPMLALTRAVCLIMCEMAIDG